MERARELQDSKAFQLHVVMFPWFAFGHIYPFAQLSNKLSSHGIRISFISAPQNISRTSSILNINEPNIEIISVQIPTIEGLPQGLESTANMTPAKTELLKKALDQMQPQIKTQLVKLKPQFVFHDFAQQWLPPLAFELGIKSFFFSVFSAACAGYITIPARLKPTPETETPSLDDMKKPPLGFPSTSITSLKTYEASDFLYVFKRFYDCPSVFDRVLECTKGCTAIVLKTCTEIEGPYIDFVKTQHKKPVFLLGPMVQEPAFGILDEKWTKWLGSFPAKSVIYCCFGSEAFLEDAQIEELVLGLEATGLPFLVVLNFPDREDSKARLKSALPEGFEERVKDKGIVYTGWVQQQHILAHHSVGCFVSHSGFSSAWEGLVNDCQLVLVPQRGDQYLISRLLCGDKKAAVEVERREEDGFFKKESICKAIKTVMVDVNEEPGKSIRANHGKLKEFMLDKEIHNKLITDFINQMKEMVDCDSEKI